MFVPKTKNQIKVVAVVFGFVFFSSTAAGVFPHRVWASPVAASALIELTNAAREQDGLAPLSVNDLLTRSAQGKSDDMAQKDYFAHTSPEGLTPWYWFKLVGYDYVVAGENLAVGFASAESLFDAWMASPTHRANIMSPNFREIGIALSARDGIILVTQHFGARANIPVATVEGSTGQKPAQVASPSPSETPAAQQTLEFAAPAPLNKTVEKPDRWTRVAGYWQDVAVNEGAPITLALLVMAAIVALPALRRVAANSPPGRLKTS